MRGNKKKVVGEEDEEFQSPMSGEAVRGTQITLALADEEKFQSPMSGEAVRGWGSWVED